MKLTIDQKLMRRKAKKPNPVVYGLLMILVKFMNLACHTKFTYKAYPGKENGPFVLISNHASRVDYKFTAPVCFPHRINYVIGYNEFYNFPQNLLLKFMHVIPKKNFTPDMHAIKQIMAIINKGGHICFMPEGMSSITGMCQPVMPGSAKLLKKLGVPVYYTKISGGYLTYTKHCLDERIGRVDVTVDRMFTAEELESLDVEEITDRMNKLLAHDDYIWNKKEQVKFDGKGNMAKNLDTLLYRCPRCNEIYKMECDKNTMTCKACGNTVTIDECYNLTPSDGSICPELVTDWTIMEREKAAEEVRKEGFGISEHVLIGKLPEYKSIKGQETSVKCGEGVLTLNKTGLHFDGVKDGEKFAFDISPKNLPTYGMCTDISRLYTYVDGKFVEFFFDNGDVLYWDHLTEELHRALGGEWQNTRYR